MIFFIFILFIIALGLTFPKSKFVLALGFFLLFVVSTHFQAGNDISNIQTSFSQLDLNNEAEDRSLVFYSTLLYLNSVGFSFFQVRCLDFIIWASAISILIVKFTKLPSYVIACSILFPILSFASQMRNGLSAAFFYFGLIFLFNRKYKLLGLITFILFIFVAVVFHYLGIVYLFCLIALLPISNSKLIKYVVTISILTFILYNGGVLYNAVSYFSPYYANQYFTSSEPQSYFLVICLILGIVINYRFTIYAKDIIERHKSKYSCQDIYFSIFVSRVNLLSFIFFPLLFINGSIYRIYQTLFILSIISIANASTSYISRDINQSSAFRFLYFSFFMIVSIFYFNWQGEFLTFFNSIIL